MRPNGFAGETIGQHSLRMRLIAKDCKIKIFLSEENSFTHKLKHCIRPGDSCSKLTFVLKERPQGRQWNGWTVECLHKNKNLQEQKQQEQQQAMSGPASWCDSKRHFVPGAQCAS